MEPQTIEPEQKETVMTAEQTVAQPEVGNDQATVPAELTMSMNEVTEEEPAPPAREEAPAAEPTPTEEVPITPEPTPMVAAPAEAAPQVEKAPVSTKKGRRSLKTVLVVLFVLVAFVGGYFASLGVTRMSQTNASKQAKAFIVDLNKGNFTAAYNMGTANLRKQQTEKQFESNVGVVSDTKPSFTDEAIAFNGSIGTYVVTETGLPPTSDGSNEGTFTISLAKDGLLNWKIDSVSVN